MSATQVVSFTRMADGTAADYALLDGLERQHVAGTADRLLEELARQAEGLPGYRVSRLEHALQSATRALGDHADEDWVVAALLHDVGDGLAPLNHSALAAAILEPFVREEVTWVVRHHGLFQSYYYAHHLGGDRHARNRYAGHPCFQSCVDFCARWDQNCFDPDYPSVPLERFRPMVHSVFSRQPFDPEVLAAGVVRGLPPSRAAA